MYLEPLPTQLSGAKFLAVRKHAGLWDEPRVGKTGTALIAADYVLARKILIVTTASGRAVWKRGIAGWSALSRSVTILTSKNLSEADRDVIIVGWPTLNDPKVRSVLIKMSFDLVILDEAHYAKNPESKRTQAAYGTIDADGDVLLSSAAVTKRAKQVWALTGTPIPHAPNDLYPMMRALCPDRLLADETRGWPAVTKYQDFLHRYCVVKMKQLSRFNRIPVVIGGRNLPELKARLDGFFLLRTQADVGIRAPSYDLLPLIVSEKQRRECEKDLDRDAILKAAASGATKELDMHLGPLRRITGEIKAHAVVEAVREEFECGLDKIVLAYWHKDVGQILKEGLSAFGVVYIDGSTSIDKRAEAETKFRDPKGPRVFLAQIDAAGEAIDLSASAVLWFVEQVFSPRAMKQMSLRITNHTQTRSVLVRVCVLEGSIDEALQASLLRLWTAIKEVLS